MSTTSGADTDLDLDAIEARANAATEGPWEAEWAEFDGYKIDDVAGNWDYEEGGILGEDNAEFIAHARTDVPALVAEVRRLRPRVISGDVGSVTAALDGLPVGSIITCEEDDEARETGEWQMLTYQKPTPSRWFEIGFPNSISSARIARYRVPITVLREGTGA